MEELDPNEIVKFKVTNRCKLENGQYADRGDVVEMKLHNALRLTEAGCGFPKDLKIRDEVKDEIEEREEAKTKEPVKVEKSKEEIKQSAEKKVGSVIKKKKKKKKETGSN